MNAGDRPHRVSLQTRTEVPDGHDGFTETWTTVQSRLSAKVIDLVGRDLERARQVDPRSTHEVRFGFWRAYNEAFNGGRARVIWHDEGAMGNRTLEIVTPPQELKHRELLSVFAKELR